MAVSQHRDIGIVINIDEMFPPPDKHGISRIQDNLDGSFELRGPSGHVPQWSFHPIFISNIFGHLVRRKHGLRPFTYIEPGRLTMEKTGGCLISWFCLKPITPPSPFQLTNQGFSASFRRVFSYSYVSSSKISKVQP
jgi:hypothetical protein